MDEPEAEAFDEEEEEENNVIIQKYGSLNHWRWIVFVRLFKYFNSDDFKIIDINREDDTVVFEVTGNRTWEDIPGEKRREFNQLAIDLCLVQLSVRSIGGSLYSISVK